MTDPDGTDKSPHRIAGMFDAIAGRYDFLNHVLSSGIDYTWRRRAIKSLALTGTERVLDLCTGTGDLAIAACTASPSAARVTGLDFSHEMLRVAHSKVRRRAAAVALVRGDATRIPAASQSFDAVTIAFGIRNVERPEVACREMHRVMRPRGRLAILEFAVPTVPILRSMYLAYFRHVLPRIGAAISGHPAAYAYLPASVNVFPTPDRFVTILRQSGFVDIAAVPLTAGTVFLYTAVAG